MTTTCPRWRFRVFGDAIPAKFRRWIQGGVPHAARQAHVLTIAGDRILRDEFWCGGRWPAPLLAEMEAARR